MVLRPLVLLLALVVSGEEMVGGEPQVLPLSSTEEWSPDPRQIIYHGGQWLRGGDPGKGKDLNP